MFHLGLSPITDSILAGQAKDMGNGVYKFTSDPIDVTNEALKVVFEWFMSNMKNVKDDEYFSLSFEKCDYILLMKKKD